ncbi:MAG: autotransporter outer membrane beta-barrel domain-containing protein, partial [Methylobacillus sp.]|nr:autotransporter outer membrane beta-barrel domain-containing protein [Methylobacillus sp.]
MVGDTSVQGGGIFAPGNGAGTFMTVGGDLTLNQGAIYRVAITPTTAPSYAQVTGAANLNGATVSVQATGVVGDYTLGAQYTILHSTGGVTGQFNPVVTSNLAFLNAELDYTGTDVFLTLVRNTTSFGGIIGGTPNQRATGTGILGSGAVFNAVVGLSAPQALAAYDQLSGEIHASTQTALMADSHFLRDLAFDRLRFAQNGADSEKLAASGMLLAYAGDDLGSLTSPSSDPERGVMWARTFGSWGTFDGDGNAASLDRDTGGMLFGADGSLGGWRIGALAGVSQTDLDVSRRRSSADSDNYHLGLYAGT